MKIVERSEKTVASWNFGRSTPTTPDGVKFKMWRKSKKGQPWLDGLCGSCGCCGWCDWKGKGGSAIRKKAAQSVDPSRIEARHSSCLPAPTAHATSSFPCHRIE